MNKKCKGIFSMKKMLLSATAAMTLATAAVASDYYAGVGYVMPSVTGYSGGSSLAINGGKKFDNNWRVELELTNPLSKPAAGSVEVEVKTTAVYGVYNHKINEQFAVNGKIGYLSESVTLSNGVLSASATDSGLSYGVQGEYAVSKTIGAYVDYTIVEADINFITLGAHFAF